MNATPQPRSDARTTARPRRRSSAGAGLAILGLLVTACGGGGGDESDGGVELRFTWWGGDTRQAYTRDIIDAFEEQHPHITVRPEFEAWEGYWDSLATQSAARDTPDVMQMDLMYIREYLENGLLLALEDVDTSAFTEELLSTGAHEGTLYGMPVGSTSFTLVANPEIFAEAGLDLPDDETWTWEDWASLSQEISENTEAFGQTRPFGDAGFEIWLRQHHGVSMIDASGELAWDPGEAAGYFEMLDEARGREAVAPASQISEDRTAGLEQTAIATGGSAMDAWWDTQIVALSGGAEDIELVPLRFPSEAGRADEAEIFYKASMFYSVSSGTEYPEEAQLFVDFLVNSEEAGRLQLIERGIPGNEDIRDLIRDELSETEARVLQYNEELEDVVAESPPLPPEGYGAVQEIIWRYEDEFLFDRVTADEAAERMHREIEAAIR
ncbi:ABC transporter substrate-binding protein [Nesterenkonia suensis]